MIPVISMIHYDCRYHAHHKNHSEITVRNSFQFLAINCVTAASSPSRDNSNMGKI